jgi:hypothetical protein
MWILVLGSFHFFFFNIVGSGFDKGLKKLHNFFIKKESLRINREYKSFIFHISPVPRLGSHIIENIN